MEPVLRPHIEKLADSIDAAIFTGDQFMEAPARERLRWYMARWEKALAAFDNTSEGNEQ